MAELNSDSESSHSSQCDSEYDYIPGYIIEDETRNINDQEYNIIDENHGESESYLYADEPMAEQAWYEDYVEKSNEHKKKLEMLQKRLDHTVELSSWCKCGFCQVTLLQNPLEAWCCQELKFVAESLTHQSVLADLSTIPCCVTLYPGFRPVCLEKWSLKMAARKYKTSEQRRYRETGSENMNDSILCYFPVFKYILVL
ncbi:uncharacterized protein LOC124454435 [Xenia sp. Carnegie-2017]|uniref:uncharacterized protein LOC124454435 n=1 Tax=Xenia sp. Carnegie-2017 TaxID=2897299 RepID=UPI001F04A344|nr:uncharacterized protein LOC124454435 [Xenia sp. Carnegie-2017]